MVPPSPTSVLTSGSTSGAKTVTADVPLTRFDGTAISVTPITSYTVRAYLVSGGALAGSNTGASLPITITGLPAAAMVATVSATNAGGPSNESLPSDPWTGT